MKPGLLFTTMANHRPVYGIVTTAVATPGTSSAPSPAPRQPFHPTTARDPTEPNPNPNIPSPVSLRNLLERSRQPIFSVSALFRMKAGGGCGACGH
jgi:hypothetical protein